MLFATSWEKQQTELTLLTNRNRQRRQQRQQRQQQVFPDVDCQQKMPGNIVSGEVWKMMNGEDENGLSLAEREYIWKHHKHHPAENQCTSILIKRIKAPVHLVWSLVRRFDQPQKYKPFISRCVVQGNLEIGSLREIDIRSGLPATTSTERLELLNDEEHVLSMRIIGGDHRLRNYSSIISVHPDSTEGRRGGALVIESFVVDIPEGNTKDDTCYFVEAVITCNLKSLGDVSEMLARTEQIDKDKPE